MFYHFNENLSITYHILTYSYMLNIGLCYKALTQYYHMHLVD
jgi:hypothetical protein